MPPRGKSLAAVADSPSQPSFEIITYNPSKKTHKTREEDLPWEKFRHIICQQYQANDLSHVIEYMRKEHGFFATSYQYKYRLHDCWKLSKRKNKSIKVSDPDKGITDVHKPEDRGPAEDSISSDTTAQSSLTNNPLIQKQQNVSLVAHTEQIIESKQKRAGPMTTAVKRPLSQLTEPRRQKKIKVMDRHADNLGVNSVPSLSRESSDEESRSSLDTILTKTVNQQSTENIPLVKVYTPDWHDEDFDPNMDGSEKVAMQTCASSPIQDYQAASGNLMADVYQTPKEQTGSTKLLNKSTDPHASSYTWDQVCEIRKAAEFFSTCWRFAEAYQLHALVWKWLRQPSRPKNVEKERFLQQRTLLACFRAAESVPNLESVGQMSVEYLSDPPPDGMDSNQPVRAIDTDRQLIELYASLSHRELETLQPYYHKLVEYDSFRIHGIIRKEVLEALPFQQALEVVYMVVFPRPSNTGAVIGGEPSTQVLDDFNVFPISKKLQHCGIRLIVEWCQQKVNVLQLRQSHHLLAGKAHLQKWMCTYDLFFFFWKAWTLEDMDRDPETIRQHGESGRSKCLWTLDMEQALGMSSADMLYTIVAVIVRRLPLMCSNFPQQVIQAFDYLLKLTDVELVELLLRAFADRHQLRYFMSKDLAAKHAAQDGALKVLREATWVVPHLIETTKSDDLDTAGGILEESGIPTQESNNAVSLSENRISYDPTLAESIASSDQSSIRRLASWIKQRAISSSRSSLSVPSGAMGSPRGSMFSLDVLRDSLGSLSISDRGSSLLSQRLSTQTGRTMASIAEQGDQAYQK